MPKGTDPEAFRMVNCAVCECEMLGESDRHNLTRWSAKWWQYAGTVLRAIHTRIKGRPVCPQCFDELQKLRAQHDR